MDTVVLALRTLDLATLRAAVSEHPDAARSPCAIVEARRLGWKSGLALLVRHGADLNSSWRGYRPLHALLQEEPHGDRAPASKARVACLEWMLAHGASANVPDGSGWTAQHQAASRGNRRMLSALIAAGGDLTRRDAWGQTSQRVRHAKRALRDAGGRA